MGPSEMAWEDKYGQKDKRHRLVNCLLFEITFSVLFYVLRAEQIVSSETHSTRSNDQKDILTNFQVYIGVPHNFLITR